MAIFFHTCLCSSLPPMVWGLLISVPPLKNPGGFTPLRAARPLNGPTEDRGPLDLYPEATYDSCLPVLLFPRRPGVHDGAMRLWRRCFCMLGGIHRRHLYIHSRALDGGWISLPPLSKPKHPTPKPGELGPARPARIPRAAREISTRRPAPTAGRALRAETTSQFPRRQGPGTTRFLISRTAGPTPLPV